MHITRHGQILPPHDSAAGEGDPSPLDPNLSALGRRQAYLLGRRLKEVGFRGLVHSSPFRRTAETAQIVAETVDSGIVLSPPLRESNGSAEHMARFRGATGAILQTEFPRIQGGEDLAFPWWTTAPERPDDVEHRVGPLLEALEVRGREVLLVGHAASVGAATRCVLRKFAPDLLGRPRFSWNCMLTSFRLIPVFECLELASTSHLPGGCMTSNLKTRAEVVRILGQKSG